MTSKLALGASVAAIVLCTTSLGASAQTYEVTKLVPGSAFHGVHGLGIDKATGTIDFVERGTRDAAGEQ